MIFVVFFFLIPTQVPGSPSSSKVKPFQQIGKGKLEWRSLNVTADYITISPGYRRIHEKYDDEDKKPEIVKYTAKSENECEFSYKELGTFSSDGTPTKSAVLNCPFALRVDKTAKEWYQSMYDLALTRMHRNELATDLTIIAGMINFNRKGNDPNDPKGIDFALVTDTTIRVKSFQIFGKTRVNIYGGLATHLNVTDSLIVQGTEIQLSVETFSVWEFDISRSKRKQANAVSRLFWNRNDGGSEFVESSNIGVSLHARKVAEVRGRWCITNFTPASVNIDGNWRAYVNAQINIDGHAEYREVDARANGVRHVNTTPEREARLTRQRTTWQRLSVMFEENEAGDSEAADPGPRPSSEAVPE